MWSNGGQAKLAIAGSNLTGVDTSAPFRDLLDGGGLFLCQERCTRLLYGPLV